MGARRGVASQVQLTPRERDVLREMAEGSRGVAARLLTERSVEKVDPRPKLAVLKAVILYLAIASSAGQRGSDGERRRTAERTPGRGSGAPGFDARRRARGRGTCCLLHRALCPRRAPRGTPWVELQRRTCRGVVLRAEYSALLENWDADGDGGVSASLPLCRRLPPSHVDWRAAPPTVGWASTAVRRAGKVHLSATKRAACIAGELHLTTRWCARFCLAPRLARPLAASSPRCLLLPTLGCP